MRQDRRRMEMLEQDIAAMKAELRAEAKAMKAALREMAAKIAERTEDKPEPGHATPFFDEKALRPLVARALSDHPQSAPTRTRKRTKKED